MKLKLHKEHKEHKDKGRKAKGAIEEENLLQPQKKLLSFTRTKDRKPKSQDVKQTTGPDLEDFRDLIDDEEESVTEDSKLFSGHGMKVTCPFLQSCLKSLHRKSCRYPQLETLHPLLAGHTGS